MAHKREKWIDYTKVLACVLVATGHFFMSMVESGIVPETTLYKWFITSIYYFHVPLFFVCSGYLYQKRSIVTSISSWKKHILHKAVTLGIPYFVFTMVTWILKKVFSGSVNIQNDGLLVTLCLKPASPYWYLYTLFFVFSITPTFTAKKNAVFGVCAAVILNYIQTSGIWAIDVYAISQTSRYLVWFVAGMCLCIFEFPDLYSERWKTVGVTCGAVFLALSWLDSAAIPLVMGTLGCMAVILLMCNLHLKNWSERVMDILSRYTMPVFLMHTIFAAGVRAVLIKLMITNACVHIAIGLAASFVGPMLAADIMKWLKLDVLLYPGKYLKKRS